MKASEQWLIERLPHLNLERGLRYEDQQLLHVARQQYAQKVARIDAAEERFYECSEDARDRALIHVREANAWDLEPQRWEALADVAEGIDRRASAGEPTDGEMLDWLAGNHIENNFAGWSVSTGLYHSVLSSGHKDPRSAIRAALLRERGAESESPPARQICVACLGTGWLEGSPAFRCPDCDGSGYERERAEGGEGTDG